jgi:superfamily II DNA or RNA helicase
MKTRNDIQEEALSKILPLKRAGLGISVRVGKTLIGFNRFKVLKESNPKATALVVFPKKIVASSWVSEAKKFNMSNLLNNIAFTTYLSLKKQSLNYDIVFLDECHSLKYSHKSWLEKYDGIIVGLTGTPPLRKGEEKYEMVNEYCPIIYEYKTKDAVNSKILNDYSILVHLLPLSEEKNIKVKDKWWASENDTYDYWTRRCDTATSDKEAYIFRIMRMKSMMTFPTKENYTKKLLDKIDNKCIIFANECLQADRIYKHSYHSNNPKSEKNLQDFQKGKITKLSCVEQLSEGVTIKDLKECIIMHSYSNNRKSAQRIGRLLGLIPNETAKIHILCYKDTVDEKWVKNALNHLDSNKIKYIQP